MTTPRIVAGLRVALLSFLIAAAAPAQSVSTGAIEGRAFNPATGENLELARITVEGTSLETFSDADGQYRLANVPAGAARVRAFRTGVVTQTHAVTVATGQIATLNFELAAFSARPAAEIIFNTTIKP